MRWTKIVLPAAAGLMLALPAAYGQTPRPVQIQAGRTTSYLGVGLQDINAQRAAELKLPEDAGVEITQVTAESPAAAAGLKAGDVILQYNGEHVLGIEQITRLVQETPAGREVKLQIFRDGNSLTVTAKIGSHQAPAFWPQTGAGLPFPTQPPRLPVNPRLLTPPPSGGAAELGIQAIQVEGQLADYFGVRQGVLVASVMPGSSAEKAGIKAGDVITRAGDARVATPADITNQIRALSGKALSLTIMRDHREMTLSAPMDDGF